MLAAELESIDMVIAAALATLAATGAGSASPLPRFPQAYAGRIVFVAEGNLWSIPREGGEAQLMHASRGQDLMPRVSPDGRWIAFTQSTRAGTDVWAVPSQGGAARKLTHRPAVTPGTGSSMGPDNLVVTWTPDSRNVVYLTKQDQWNAWIRNMYAAPIAGGPAQPMPIDSAVGLASYAPDGHTIAYNRILHNFHTWKRYNGGLADQVFTYNFHSRKLTQITDWSGSNTSPMWYGDKIYFLSDRDPNRRANIWVRDLRTGQDRQVTHFADYDIDFPALGDQAITFQEGGKLYLLSLPDEHLREVAYTLPGSNPRTQPRDKVVGDEIRETDARDVVDYALSPDGSHAIFAARGHLFTVPRSGGTTIDLTSAVGVDEDHPAWSPDGRWIAYTTDSTGSEQVAVRSSSGGRERTITHFATGYFYRPVFSPDGQTISFSDSEHRLWLTGTSGGGPRMVAQDKLQEILDQSFSPDGHWLAFSMAGTPGRSDLYLFEIATGRLTRVGPGNATDSAPTWSTDGDYLFFLSHRHEVLAASDQENDYAEVQSAGIYAIALSRKTPSPLAPIPETPPVWKDAPKEKQAAVAPVHIDLDGLMDRAVVLPVGPAAISQIAVQGQRILYLTNPTDLAAGKLKDQHSELRSYDLVGRIDCLLARDATSFAAAQATDAVLLNDKGKGYATLSASDPTPAPVNLAVGDVRMRVEPAREWAEMFDYAWRSDRDLFVSRAMNGVDWNAVHERYSRLVPQLGSREDLKWLIGQVQGELGNSHAYVSGGDSGDDSKPAPPPVLLGVDWKIDRPSQRYRLSRIYPGDNSREDYRSPLHQPGLDVREGDYVLAINGTQLGAPTTPDELLQASPRGKPVELTVARTPYGPQHPILVKPVSSEISLREAAWAAHSRETVDRLSGGRVGYIYLTNMSERGLQQFSREFYEQLDKQALIIDDRWNQGGSIASYIIDRLRRHPVAMTMYRVGGVETQPERLLNGPKVVLVNHWSASNGDLFPFLFQKYGLGKVIGTRTWGGLRGIRTEWQLLDGGTITIPERAVYNMDGSWAVENHGVDPDILVENEPADLLDGHDKQLEAAVGELFSDIAKAPPKLPAPPPLLPAYPPAGMVGAIPTARGR